jgi:hypothetical protein
MLTQTEADQFIQMVKHFVRAPASIAIPPGLDETYELASSMDKNFQAHICICSKRAMTIDGPMPLTRASSLC